MFEEPNADIVELMDWAVQNTTGEEPERFTIDSDVKADWAIRKIAEANDECERMNSVRRARIASLQQAIEDEEAIRDRKISNLSILLQDYMATVPTKESKTQHTYKLPSGTLVMKKASTALVAETEKLTAWLTGAKLTDFLKVTTSPRWGEFKKHLIVLEDGKLMFEDTGEVLPDGTVTLIEIPAEFKVSAK